METQDMATKYRQINEKDVPDNVRFDVPRRNQGQIVEVAYGDDKRYRGEFGPGDQYKRVTDRSDGSVRYYRLEAE